MIQGDVTNRGDMIRALDGVDAVFHLAAYQDYMTDFSTFIRTNTESTALLFELIVERRLPVKKIIFASSQSVAGEGRYRCEEHGVVFPGPRPLEQLRRGEWEVYCPKCGRTMTGMLIEESTAAPHTTYAISKYAIELLGRSPGTTLRDPHGLHAIHLCAGGAQLVLQCVLGYLPHFCAQNHEWPAAQLL